MPDLQDNLGNTWHLAVGAGKDGHIDVANRDQMGKSSTSSDSGIYQEIGSNAGRRRSALPIAIILVYYGAVGDRLRAISITNAKLNSPSSSQTSAAYAFPGTTPSISANGSSNGIVWAVENKNGGVLHAYDATNLATELYNSNQAANGRDTLPTTSSLHR